MTKIPTVNTCKISGGFTNEPKKFQRQLTKREGGAMLIDFTELPQPNIKRRKKSEMNETIIPATFISTTSKKGIF